MIRFVDVRGQGLQARFSFWDTVRDRYLDFGGDQAWDTWSDFEEAARPICEKVGRSLSRYADLCPDWVYGAAVDGELGFSAGLPMGAGWRDMRSAPRNGTKIIALFGGGDVLVIWHQARGERTGWMCGRQRYVTPTYWMPLPPIPAAGA